LVVELWEIGGRENEWGWENEVEGNQVTIGWIEIKWWEVDALVVGTIEIVIARLRELVSRYDKRTLVSWRTSVIWVTQSYWTSGTFEWSLYWESGLSWPWIRYWKWWYWRWTS